MTGVNVQLCCPYTTPAELLALLGWYVHKPSCSWPTRRHTQDHCRQMFSRIHDFLSQLPFFFLAVS